MPTAPPSSLPTLAKAALSAAFSALAAPSGERAFHYLLAAGPDARDPEAQAVRLVLAPARDGTPMRDAALHRLYAGDEALSPATMRGMGLSRGVILAREGELAIVPAKRLSAERTEAGIRKLLRALDAQMAAAFPHAGFKRLLRAPVAEPEDPAAVVARVAPSATAPVEAPPAATDDGEAEAALAAWSAFAREAIALVVEVAAIPAEDATTRAYAREAVGDALTRRQAHEDTLARLAVADPPAPVARRLDHALVAAEELQAELEALHRALLPATIARDERARYEAVRDRVADAFRALEEAAAGLRVVAVVAAARFAELAGQAREDLADLDALAITDAPLARELAEALEAPVRDATAAAARATAIWRAYRKQRADVVAAIREARPFSAETVVDGAARAVGEADDLAAAGELERAARTLAGAKASLVDEMRHELAALATLAPDEAWLAADRAFVHARLAEAERALADDDWRGTASAAGRVMDRLRALARVHKARETYDTARTATLVRLEAVRRDADLFGVAARLEKRIGEADAVAARERTRFRSALERLSGIDAEADALLAASAAKTAYLDARARLDTELRALAAHARAGDVAATLGALRGERVAAETLAAEGDHRRGRARVERALAQADLALRRLDALAEDAALEQADPADADGARALLTELRARLAAFVAEPHATPDEVAVARIADALDEAEAQLADGLVAYAAVPLRGAAGQLRHLRAATTDPARFGAERAALGARLTALRERPSAAALDPVLGPVTTALERADGEARRLRWGPAFAALDVAHEAFAAAERVAVAVDTFDTRMRRLTDRAARLPASERARVKLAVDRARAAAGRLALDEAARALDEAEVAVEGAELGLLALPPKIAPRAREEEEEEEEEEDEEEEDEAPPPRRVAAPRDEEEEEEEDEIETVTPPAGTLEEHARALVRLPGGPARLDALVASLPDTVPFATIAALARVRFDLALTTDHPSESRSAKGVWSLLAKVPDEHVRDNPMLRAVALEEPESEGGAYERKQRRVVMNGRPGKGRRQEFGAALRGPELPVDVAPEARPADEDALPYFDFATLHEVGHAVDARVRFMAARLGEPAFGGWRVWNDLQLLANEVAAGLHADPDHVLALLESRAPGPDPGTDAEATRARKRVEAWFAAATAPDPWYHQDQTDAATVGGRVVQRPYDGYWVSYDAGARKLGITGYQFRAPDEWFAELYAAFHAKKLKPDHPARAWLERL